MTNSTSLHGIAEGECKILEECKKLATWGGLEILAETTKISIASVSLYGKKISDCLILKYKGYYTRTLILSIQANGCTLASSSTNCRLFLPL